MTFDPGKTSYGPVVVATLFGLIVLFDIIITGQVLFGLLAVLLVILVYLCWWYLRAFDLVPKDTGYMPAVVAVLAGGVFLYGLLIAQEIYLGTLTALVVILSVYAWQFP